MNMFKGTVKHHFYTFSDLQIGSNGEFKTTTKSSDELEASYNLATDKL